MGEDSVNYNTGKLTKENWLAAKELLSSRLSSEGTPMKASISVEILPPPAEVGDVIFSQIGNEYVAVRNSDDCLIWRRTGGIMGNSRGCPGGG